MFVCIVSTGRGRGTACVTKQKLITKPVNQRGHTLPSVAKRPLVRAGRGRYEIWDEYQESSLLISSILSLLLTHQLPNHVLHNSQCFWFLCQCMCRDVGVSIFDMLALTPLRGCSMKGGMLSQERRARERTPRKTVHRPLRQIDQHSCKMPQRSP